MYEEGFGQSALGHDPCVCTARLGSVDFGPCPDVGERTDRMGLAVGLLYVPQPARLSRMTQPACLSTPQPALVCQLYPRQDEVVVTTPHFESKVTRRV